MTDDKGEYFSFKKVGIALDVALFRALSCFCIFVLCLDMPEYISRLRIGSAYTPIQYFRIFQIDHWSNEPFVYLAYGLQFTILLSALGIFARLNLFFSVILSLLVFGFAAGFTHSPFVSHYHSHSRNLIVFFMPILLFAPGVGRISVFSLFKKNKLKEDISAPAKLWPLYLVQFTIGFLYFAIIANRLHYSGFALLTGDWLHSSLMSAYMYSGNPLVYKIANNNGLIVIGSLYTSIFEFFFLFVILFRRNLIPYFLAAGISMHYLIYELMYINFMLYVAPYYLAFLRWRHVEKVLALFAVLLGYSRLSRGTVR